MKYLLILLAVISITGQACSSDFDCQFGSTCVKTGYNWTGVCLGGLQPGNQNDNHPSPQEGQPCTGPIECGLGHQCVKQFGSMYGVCI